MPLVCFKFTKDLLKIWERKRLYPILLMGVILILAWWIRMDGLRWGLPFRLHPDEWKYVSAAAGCHLGHWNPKYFRNPPGYSYLNALWYPLWLQLRTPVQVPDWLGIDPVWLKPSTVVEATFYYRPFDLVLGTRFLSAFLGGLTCLAVFLLGRKLGPLRLAAAAALLSAFSFANVRESHFAVNDAPMTCLVTWVLWLAIHATQKTAYGSPTAPAPPSRKFFFLAAALGGIAVAFKYNAAPVLPALTGIYALSLVHHHPKRQWLFLVGRDTVIAAGLALLFFLIVCPFPLIDSETFSLEMKKLSSAAANPWQGQSTQWSGGQLIKTIWESEGAFSFVLALVGIGSFIRKKTWSILLFPLLYGLLAVTHALFFVRFSLPLLPWAALFAAQGIEVLICYLPIQKRMQTLFFGALVLLCGYFPLMKDIQSNYLLHQTDTRIEFLRWMKTQESSRVLIAVDQFAIPLQYRSVAGVWSQRMDPRLVPIDRLPSANLERLDSLARVPTGYVAVSTFVTFPGYLPDTYLERRTAVMAYTHSQAPSLLFQPFIGSWQPQMADVEDTYSPFRNLWNRNRPGAVIELFEVDRPSTKKPQ